MVANHNDIEKRLWHAADELRANSKLRASEYSVPVLGLIFLRYADYKFSAIDEQLRQEGRGRRGGLDKSDYMLEVWFTCLRAPVMRGW
jgi:type I restriction enzyme M protein